jgi:hypothetical protein
MKWLLLICLILLIAWQSLSIKKTAAVTTQAKTEQLIKDTIHFAQQVQPILVKLFTLSFYRRQNVYANAF